MNPFDFDGQVTDEMIAAIPAEHRGRWEQVREQQALGRQLLADAIEQGDWQKALMLCDSKRRASVLIKAGEQLDRDALRELLADWWSTTEAWSAIPEQREGMFDLVRRAAPVIVPNDNPKGRPLPPSAGSFKVYRGNLGEQPHGGSWTMERDVAELFARMAMSPRGMFLGMWREDGVPSIWEAWCEGSDVLGFFDDRQESEIVTDYVKDVQLIAQARPS